MKAHPKTHYVRVYDFSCFIYALQACPATGIRSQRLNAVFYLYRALTPEIQTVTAPLKSLYKPGGGGTHL